MESMGIHMKTIMLKLNTRYTDNKKPEGRSRNAQRLELLSSAEATMGQNLDTRASLQQQQDAVLSITP